jgi:acetyl-CoA carboxylase carboxyl transferase subunit beta
MPDGLWQKCENCRELIYAADLHANLYVCPKCTFHHALTAHQRIEQLADPDSFVETEHELRSIDTLGFTVNAKPYVQRLREAEQAAGVPEAVVSGTATIDHLPIVLAVMAKEFLGGSTGSVAGEKIARAAERAIDEHRALVVVSGSGGMRLHEGLVSLMQMAKTSAAISRLHRARLPFLSVLNWVVLGGTTASWASLGDVIIAEPGTQVGFSGPRVLAAIKVKLPDEVQRAEFMHEHGMIDLVIPRAELRPTVVKLLKHFGMRPVVADVQPELAGVASVNGRLS